MNIFFNIPVTIGSLFSEMLWAVGSVVAGRDGTRLEDRCKRSLLHLRCGLTLVPQSEEVRWHQSLLMSRLSRSRGWTVLLPQGSQSGTLSQCMKQFPSMGQKSWMNQEWRSHSTSHLTHTLTHKPLARRSHSVSLAQWEPSEASEEAFSSSYRRCYSKWKVIKPK